MEKGRRWRMIIFVTDEGRYWNHNNPILEKYADCVVVICLNGKKVTDKYQCIIVPYDHQPHLGMTDYSVLSTKFMALKQIRDEIRYSYSYHEDIVFLADTEPQSLYPYLVLKDDEEYNRMHLWCMSPWRFEGRSKRSAYEELLQDISKLTSLCYIESEMLLEKSNMRTTLLEADRYGMEWLNSMLTSALYEISNNMRWDKKYYFDLKTERYICTENSYDEVLKVKRFSKKKIDEHHPLREIFTLGRMVESLYPSDKEDSKCAVEQLHPRVDGKVVCEELKKLRKELADANGISFFPVDCPSTGACAGTCQRCDMELEYLQRQLHNIPEEKRVYPSFDVMKRSYDTPVKVRQRTEEDINE